MATKIFPATVLAGDTLKVTITSPYNASDGFGVTVHVNGPSGSQAPTQESYETTEVDDTTFELTVAPNETTAYAAGLYAYAITAVTVTEQYTIEQGTFTVELRADLVSGDFRSQAQQTLDAIEAALLGTATKNQLSYTIAGRSISRIPIADLRGLKQDLRQEIQKESGTARRQKLYVRLS